MPPVCSFAQRTPPHPRDHIPCSSPTSCNYNHTCIKLLSHCPNISTLSPRPSRLSPPCYLSSLFPPFSASPNQYLSSPLSKHTPCTSTSSAWPPPPRGSPRTSRGRADSRMPVLSLVSMAIPFKPNQERREMREEKKDERKKIREKDTPYSHKPA